MFLEHESSIELFGEVYFNSPMSTMNTRNSSNVTPSAHFDGFIFRWFFFSWLYIISRCLILSEATLPLSHEHTIAACQQEFS